MWRVCDCRMGNRRNVRIALMRRVRSKWRRKLNPGKAGALAASFLRKTMTLDDSFVRLHQTKTHCLPHFPYISCFAHRKAATCRNCWSELCFGTATPGQRCWKLWASLSAVLSAVSAARQFAFDTRTSFCSVVTCRWWMCQWSVFFLTAVFVKATVVERDASSPRKSSVVIPRAGCPSFLRSVRL
jgi:hypothetical protein